MPTTVHLTAGAIETDIINALNMMTDGGTLVLPQDATIAISKGIVVDLANRDITIDLNGSTLVQTANVKVITALGNHGPLQGVVLGQDAAGNATITYDKPPDGLAAGDWVKVVSDDPIPGDHIDPSDNNQPTRLGQAAEAIAIDGNTVTLRGPFVDQGLYLTNVRATEYQTGKFVLENGAIAGAPSYWIDLVQVRSTIGAEVNNVDFSGGQGSGVNVVDCANVTITDCVATDLGAGVHSAASLNTSMNGLFAEHLAHGVFDNCVGTASDSGNSSQYGADIGLNARACVVYDANRAAYDFHSEAVNGRYENDLAFDSRMFGDFRGFNNAIVNSAGAGNDYGLQYNEYGTGDARGNLVSNMTLRETANYSFIISNQPAGNLVENSTFESYGTGYRVPADIVTFENTRIVQNVIGDDDLLIGTAHFDYLLGGAGVDVVDGAEGDDYVWGGQGADALRGGAGRDRFAYHSLSESGDTILDFATGAGGDVLDVSVLGIRLGWARSDPLATGEMRAMQSDTDTLVQARDGAGGWVTLATLSAVNASTFRSCNLQVTLSGNLVERFVLSGSASSDNLTGSAADETLDGGKGADAMAGSSGDDVYFVDDSADQVVELVGGGTDTVYASVNYALQPGSEIEILAATAGLTGLHLTGNEFDNIIRGGDGDDSLRGLAGNDTLEGGGGNDSLNGGPGSDLLIGGSGDDTYFVQDANDRIVETIGGGTDTVFVSTSYSLAADAEVEFLRAHPAAGDVALKGNGFANTIQGAGGNDAIDGGDGNDSLAGAGGNDVILGGNGNDRIDGGAGIDTLAGGAGNDIYNVDNAADSVVEFAGDGFDTVWASTSYTLQAGSEIEMLRAVGPGALTLTGNEFGNTIQGDAGADVLDGRGGNDALYGGGDSDVLLGGNGDDRLDGGTGADAMAGGAGNDVYLVDNPGDALIENADNGFDTVFTTVNYTLQSGTEVEALRAYGGTGGVTLTGNEQANLVCGGTGADALNGAGGEDTLIGGAGADTFVFDPNCGNDVVTDFSGGEDVISITGSIFADFDALIANAAQSGADTVISWDAGNSITLQNVSLASLHDSDFIL